MKDKFILEGSHICYISGSTGKKTSLLQLPGPEDNGSDIPLAHNDQNPQKTVVQQYAGIAARLLVKGCGGVDASAAILVTGGVVEEFLETGGRGSLWCMGEHIRELSLALSAFVLLFDPGGRLFCTECDLREAVSLQNCSGYMIASPETAFEFAADHAWQVVVADGDAMVKFHSCFANLILKASLGGLILVYFKEPQENDTEELEELGFKKKSLDAAALYTLRVSRELKKLVLEETKEHSSHDLREKLLKRFCSLEEEAAGWLSQDGKTKEGWDSGLHRVARGFDTLEDELYVMQPELLDKELPYWLNRSKTALLAEFI